MMKEPSVAAVRAACRIAENRIRARHLRAFPDTNGTILIISDTYNGVWMEHVQDAQVWEKFDPTTRGVAARQASLFIDRVRPDGETPFRYTANNEGWHFSQIQECVSLATLCYEAYELDPANRAFLEKAYDACAKRDGWLVANRMQTGRGLIECTAATTRVTTTANACAV